MMNTMTSGKMVAFLAANGFEENHLIATQKMMRENGMQLKVISTDSGLIGAMAGDAWGHNHMVDAPLNTALGVDYAGVIIAGGQASHAKLKNTAHTQRFVNSMMVSGKPVIALGNASDMMSDMDMMNDSVHMMDNVAEQMMGFFNMPEDDIEVAA